MPNAFQARSDKTYLPRARALFLLGTRKNQRSAGVGAGFDGGHAKFGVAGVNKLLAGVVCCIALVCAGLAKSRCCGRSVG